MCKILPIAYWTFTSPRFGPCSLTWGKEVTMAEWAMQPWGNVAKRSLNLKCAEMCSFPSLNHCWQSKRCELSCQWKATGAKGGTEQVSLPMTNGKSSCWSPLIMSSCLCYSVRVPCLHNSDQLEQHTALQFCLCRALVRKRPGPGIRKKNSCGLSVKRAIISSSWLCSTLWV